MNDDNVVKKIEEFVQKINSREWIIAPSAQRIHVNSKWSATSNLTKELARSISDYETLIEDDPMFWNVIERFNGLINSAISHNVIQNGEKSANKLHQLENKCNNYEEQVKELQSIVNQFQNENTALKERIRIHTAMYPDLKRLDIQESEVTDE